MTSNGSPLQVIMSNYTAAVAVTFCAKSMNSLEQKLDPSQFLRIHRSRIVRAKCIRELRAIDNREYLVTLSDSSEHRSSRTYADRLDAWLSSEKR
jgi:two-component system LytT family response regulator